MGSWAVKNFSVEMNGRLRVCADDAPVCMTNRTGTEANELLRSKLSSAASATLEDIDVANEALLSSIDSETTL
jgi:hypothetical protein